MVKSYKYAATNKKIRVAEHLQPIYINNKYTNTDYDYFEEAWANTLAGTVIDKLMAFTIGHGVKPTLELVDSKGKTQKQINEKLKTFDDVINQITEYENKPEINFTQNIKDTAIMAKVFGRSVIAFEPDGSKLPEALKIIHPRDLGRVNIKSKDWSVNSISYKISEKIMADDMIYFVNKPHNPIKDHNWYGFSELQRVIGGARALRRIIEYDSPEIVESMWASYGLIIARPQSKNPTTDISTIRDNLNPGTFNVLSANPEDIRYDKLDLEPKVNELVQLIDQYERLIIGNFGVPGPLLGREEESNMATLLGKIRLFITGPVADERKWLSDILTNQWYAKLQKFLAPNTIGKIRIKADFQPIIIESWWDNVDSIQKLKQTIPGLPDSILLELIGLEKYKEELQEKLSSFDEVKKDVDENKKLTEQQIKQLAARLQDKEKILEILQEKQRVREGSDKQEKTKITREILDMLKELK